MTLRIPRTPRAAALLAVLAATLCTLTAAPLAAQIIKVPSPSDVGAPISLTATFGFLQSQGRYDGQSGAYWNLGNALMYRATLDYGIRAGALGITAGLASVPIRRVGGSAPPNSKGDIQLRELLATFRTVEGEGFYQIVEVSMGLGQWTGYSGTDVLSADEQKTRNAFALVVGYGLGIAIGQRAAFTFVQDYSTLWGSGAGLPTGQSRSVRQYTSRVGLRYRIRGHR